MDDAWVLPALPAAAFVVLLLVSQYLPRKGDYIAIAAMAAAFVLTLRHRLRHGGRHRAPSDFDAGRAELGVDRHSRLPRDRHGDLRRPDHARDAGRASPSSSLLVMIYSTGYMHGDRRYGWFFAILSLFVASMLTLVLADNLLLLYFAWELVGLCSMLLIGYYNDKQSAAEAAKKAFITTRIGDVGLLIGIIILFWQTPEHLQHPGDPPHRRRRRDRPRPG